MSEQNKASQRKFPAAIVVGAVFVVLALIGLLTVIGSCVRLGQRLLDNSREKEEFEQVIFPVVMFDPATIEDPSEMDPLVLLRSSIWSAFVSNMEKYSITSTNRISVARSDVDVACAKLFGPEIHLEHQSFSDYMNTYYYDAEKETYLAPVDSSSVLYTPQVQDIEKSGVIYTLTVGYMESGNEWMEALQGRDYEPTPDKYMTYTLKKVNDHFQLVSIQQPAEGSVPGVPDSTGFHGTEPQGTTETLPSEEEPKEETPSTTENQGTTV